MSGLEAVKEWVRGLVMLALLGTCLELLVPAHSFKKYVRMAMGLLVVLSVVRPVAALLGHPVSLETLAAAGSTESPNRPLPTLAQVMNQAAAFRQRSQALALAEARGRLAAVAREAALSVAGVGEAQAAVSVREGAAGSEIAEVAVTVRLGSAPSRISPVQPVPRVGETRPPDAQVTAAPAGLAEAIRREVAARLGISADPGRVKVYVAVPGGEQKGR